MDASFFALGLAGAFLGYIIGDFQRELRYRRDARANLAQAVGQLPVRGSDTDPGPVEYVRSGFDGFTFTRTNGDSDADSNLRGNRDRQPRRSAISRPDHRSSSVPGLPVGPARRSNAAPVGAGYDCG